MKSRFRHVKSMFAITALSASLLACQTGPGFGPGARPLNAANNVRRANTPSPNAAALDDAVRRGLDYVPGEFLVKMRPGVNSQALSAQGGLRAMNLESEPVGSPQSGIVLFKANGVRAASSDSQTLQALRSNPAVLYAEPNYIVRLKLPANEPMQQTPPQPAASKPNDPMFDQQYHHKNMDTLTGWGAEQGKKDFVLAIVDTGVDVNHPDLKDKLLPGFNTVDNNELVEDGNGHGTHCAGIAAALTNNGVGVAGVAPNVRILPVQVLSKEGSGSYASVAGGIIWAADHGAKVISMSLGGSRSSPVVTEAVKYALSKDALLVAAMGNDGAGPNGDKPILSYPAAEAGVMAVSASDSADKRARFSQVGKWNSVIAPGVNILATFPTYETEMPGKDYGAISGTSMATPAVAGLAALVRSKFPQLTQAQVKSHIEATADDLGAPGFDIQFGFGRVNVGKALNTQPGILRR